MLFFIHLFQCDYQAPIHSNNHKHIHMFYIVYRLQKYLYQIIPRDLQETTRHCSISVQFGMVSVSAGAVGAMMAAIIASMLDSCGDYIAYARTMGYPLPPKHAVNRGIAMEGLATVISGNSFLIKYFWCFLRVGVY